jgi:hypothetical protein
MNEPKKPKAPRRRRFDPKRILREIASDPNAPPTARLAALRELAPPKPPAPRQSERAKQDAVAEAALRLLNQR